MSLNYCSKCGDPIEPNEKFCNKCGNPLQTNLINMNSQPTSIAYNQNNNEQQSNNSIPTNNGYNQQLYNQKNLTNIKGILLGIGIGVGVVLIVLVFSLLMKNSNSKYYFDTNSHENDAESVQTADVSSSKKGKYSTVIIYDNTYAGVTVSSNKDAYKLIEKDSVSQKNNCPSEIKAIEDDIINKYGITAVNLCEMNADFAKEIGNVIKKIYDEYPSARGYITNLSLANVPMSGEYIAAFMPVFNFATSNSSSTYPWIIKTQVLLNTSYFLNTERLEASVTDGSNSGHFPPNATIYSPVAHEFGHYLSFLALMKHHNLESILLVDEKNINDFYNIYSDFGKGDFSLQMINEAYGNYKRDTNTTLTVDEWRGTISKYALAKDNSGNYIYDETIAESFHDVYLNGENAKDASKYIIKVLKSKLGS